MNRRPDWPERLAQEIEAASERPFSFGEHDCCAFAARCILAMTGLDCREAFDPYADEAGASAIMARYGGVRGIWSLLLGAPIELSRAGRGDVVLTQTERGEAAGICVDHRAAFPGVRGVLLMPIAECLEAWSV